MTIQSFTCAVFTASLLAGISAIPVYAQDANLSSTSAVSKLPAGPPAPGPDLLKFTPEQIEAAYEGNKVPEAVAMYLVVARDGQLDGTNGWFGPAQNCFSWQWLAEHQGIPVAESPSDP